MTIDRYERAGRVGRLWARKIRSFSGAQGRLVEKISKRSSPRRRAPLSSFGLFDRLHARRMRPRRAGGGAHWPSGTTRCRSPIGPLSAVPSATISSEPPTARRAVVVVEVADSSVAATRLSYEALKAYAAEAIPVYWIINIHKGRIMVYSRPTGPAEKPSYQDHREYGPDDEVPVVLDGREVGRISAKEILP